MSDDWFERVLRGTGDGDGGSDDEDGDDHGRATDATSAPEGAARNGADPNVEDDGDDDADADTDAGPVFGDDPMPSEAIDDPDPFAPGPDANEGVDPVGVDGVDAGPDGVDGVDAGPDGVDDFDDDGSPFEQDFASALESAPAPGGADAGDDFGFGGGDDFGFGGGPGGFDGDADFESEIDRIEVGIEGLDEMILGGVPERSLMAAIGGAGTGKTTFALQFLHHGLAAGDRGVYITLEETRERIIETADEKGWGFSEHVAADDLAVIDMDPVEMANSLASIRNDLPRLVDEFGAERLVLDSVSLLEMMYDHPADRRSEVFDFARSLKEAGVTIMVTSEASADNAYTSRHGLIEYLADAVFVLQYVRPSDFRETRLAIEIQKIRDANHSRETKPYEITDEGLSVYRQANIF